MSETPQLDGLRATSDSISAKVAQLAERRRHVDANGYYRPPAEPPKSPRVLHLEELVAAASEAGDAEVVAIFQRELDDEVAGASQPAGDPLARSGDPDQGVRPMRPLVGPLAQQVAAAEANRDWVTARKLKILQSDEIRRRHDWENRQ